MKPTMRVLHVAQPCDGGVAGCVVAASLDQAARGWQVAVACPDGGHLATDLAGTGVARLRWPARRSPGPGVLDEAQRLGRLIERWRPMVVHLHASKAGLVGRLRLRGRLPTVFQPHAWSWLAVEGAMRAASLAWERQAVRWTDRIVCVSEAEARCGRASGVRGDYTVVRNGVDLTRFHRADDGARGTARRNLGALPGVPLAVCVGRVTRQKGQDVLLSAWPLVRQRCPDAELVLVGDGDLLTSLSSRAVPGVAFAGAVNDVRTWLAAADVVVVPSRWEGLPLTVLEAFATGRPVVAGAVAGVTEIMTPAVGALVPPEDPRTLADALAIRLRDRARCRAEGEAAAHHAVEFDLRRTLDRLAAVTENVVVGEVLKPGGRQEGVRRGTDRSR